jgi:hypothetical protein
MFKKSTFSLAFVLSGFVVLPSWGQWNLSNGVAQIHSSVVNVQLFQKDINLNGNTNHGLGYYGGNTKLWENKKIDGPVLYGSSGGALGSYRITDGADAQKTALTWDRVGNVVLMKDLKVSSNLSVKKIVVDSSITILDNGKKSGYKFLRIGDDTYLSDIDRSNMIAIMGSTAEEKNPVTLQLGTNTKNRIFGRSDGKIGVSTHMEVAGSVKASKIIFPDGTSFVTAWQTPGSDFLWVSDSVKDATTNIFKKYIRYAGNQQITGTLKLGNSSLYLKGYKDATENTNEIFAENGPLLINSNSSQTDDTNTPNTILNAKGGKVGIGTATISSNAKLDIAGNVNATGYLLNGTPLLTSQWTTKADDNSISYNNGNVGIGNGKDLILKSVVGNTDAGDVIFVSGDNTQIGRIWSIKNDADPNNPINNLHFASNVSSSANLTIDRNGYVGIGTTTPNAKLEVNGLIKAIDIDLSGSLNLTNGKLSTSSIQLTSGSGENKFLVSDKDGNATWQNQNWITKYNTYPYSCHWEYFRINAEVTWSQNGDYRYTQEPYSQRKIIKTDSDFLSEYDQTYNAENGDYEGHCNFVLLQRVGSKELGYNECKGIVCTGGSNFKYYENETTYTVAKKVGIGTDVPKATLHVNGNTIVQGNIQTTEVQVCLNPGSCPDYVFEKDYRLQSLKEVEKYINQNKHLPEIPSAKEMESNGMNMKELNLSLLKKVEELTLHLIEQQKKIEVLESKIK